MRQAIRVVILIALAALALPYLLTPLYRAGHPVSALMAWRKLTGAPVSRQWIDFNAISPSLPRSVVGEGGVPDGDAVLERGAVELLVAGEV